jgi:hypothetical protein
MTLRVSVVDFTEYLNEFKLGEFTGFLQLRRPVRVWKKIFLRKDPFNRTTYFHVGAETCKIVQSDSSDRSGTFTLDFGVAELIIPVGAIVYGGAHTVKGVSVHSYRASSAQCVRLVDGCDVECKCAYSIYGRAHPCSPDDFTYTPGKMFFPAQKFSLREEICASGIHFVATCDEAWNY